MLSGQVSSITRRKAVSSKLFTGVRELLGVGLGEAVIV